MAQRQLLLATSELRRLPTERRIRSECLPKDVSLDTRHADGRRDRAEDITDLERAVAPPAVLQQAA